MEDFLDFLGSLFVDTKHSSNKESELHKAIRHVLVFISLLIVTGLAFLGFLLCKDGYVSAGCFILVMCLFAYIVIISNRKKF